MSVLVPPVKGLGLRLRKPRLSAQLRCRTAAKTVPKKNIKVSDIGNPVREGHCFPFQVQGSTFRPGSTTQLLPSHFSQPA
jgi:hypothetical protein